MEELVSKLWCINLEQRLLGFCKDRNTRDHCITRLNTKSDLILSNGVVRTLLIAPGTRATPAPL